MKVKLLAVPTRGMIGYTCGLKVGETYEAEKTRPEYESRIPEEGAIYVQALRPNPKLDRKKFSFVKFLSGEYEVICN